MKTLSIANEFSKTPGPRYIDEGEFSGEALRTTLLASMLEAAVAKEEALEVNLDGTYGYGTSFLEEAFGGLVRNNGFAVETLRKYLVIVSEEDQDFALEAWAYIDDAGRQQFGKEE